MRGYTLFFVNVIIIILMLISCPAEEKKSGVVTLKVTAAQTDSSAAIAADFAGVCHTGYSNDLEREYAMLDEMGVMWLHRDFSWSSIEPSDNNWQFQQFDNFVQRGNAEGKKIMGMLLYDVEWVHTGPECQKPSDGSSFRQICNDQEIAAFCEYAVATVKRYNGKNNQGKVDAWLIWNEPDLNPRFWTGTKGEFFALTKAAATAIRELDETEGTATVLLGGVFSPLAEDSWITGLFESEAMEKVDGVAFHPYGPLPLSSLSVFNNFKRKVTPYGFADKIWLNEVGYPTYSEKGSIPDGRYGTDQYEGDMPEAVTKTFTLLAAAGARNLTWYHLFDGATRKESDSEDWFGLVWKKSGDEWIKKGGYWGYALCANNIPGTTFKKLTFPNTVPSDIKSYYFEGNGKRTLIVWNENPLETFDVRVIAGGSNHQLWDVATGQPAAIGKTSTHTLYPVDTYQKTLLFITWDE